ncbi:hypothetical protein JTE90_004879 [Oedothorax gibbosus]|uniref:DNA-directed RNA polymerase n=1 Tax=Oedothorax gibbosus TaxID=931172 RepID=A0AAV6UU09_9ARAC|nr:hypothetical protein JTE90_004879 [Oedothorax gibbosus]
MMFTYRYLYLHDFRTLNNSGGPKSIFTNTPKIEKYAHYSTAAKPKFQNNSKVSRKISSLRLKTKPYEELLKVLEARERLLENSHTGFYCPRREPFEISNEYSEPQTFDLNTDEGIFTVKPTVKHKKKKELVKVTKASSEDQTSPAKEKQNKKQATKLKKKNKLPERHQNLRKITNHSYAVLALKSYIEVNVNADEVEKAQEFLVKQLDYLKNKYKIVRLDDPEVYNYLISGWALKGKLDKVKQVFLLMAKDDVAPNLQSYAGYLECIARSSILDVSKIRNVINELKSKGLCYQDMLQQCVFKGDQKEKVMEALEYVDDNIFSPSLQRSDSYTCKLLKPLNDKQNGAGETHPNFCFKQEDIPAITARQREIEDHYSLRISSVDAKVKMNSKIQKSRKYLNECEEDWRKTLTSAIKGLKNFEKKCYYRGYFKEESIYPYISVLETDTLVNLLLQEIRILAETGEFFSPNEKHLYKTLGIKVMNHYFVWLNKKNGITNKVLFIYQKYLSYLLDPKLLSEYSPREYWKHLKKIHFSGPTIDIANFTWPHGILIKIGSELYVLLQKNIAFNAGLIRRKSPCKVMTQAFYVHYESEQESKLSKHIKTHPLLCKLYRDAKLEYLEFDTTLVPMLSPPKPWVKFDSGGLLITSTPFIRLNDHALHQTNLYSKVPSQQLNPCFDSLNSLSNCPWIINKPVLDIVIDVFQKGGDESLDIPLNPNNLPSAPKIFSFMTKREKAVIWKQKKDLKKKKCETSSLWFDCLYKLSIANHFRDSLFWFPHNLDFRGRVYPTPPHFNHLGSDMARSILLFAEGQPLGKNGLDWLKIQLVNLTGFRKRAPNRERLEYANEIMPVIVASAEDPFGDKPENQWWRTSDKPWQTLACCKELVMAIRHPSPEDYVSHFPVHQDGSCNGLQHYAALGRDELGAIEVNLRPSDAPQDVYSGVSALVERERQKDAANGVEVAKALEGFVKRKVVKQTVMTFVYGVTKYGAKLQILKQLKDIPDFPEKYYQEGAVYLMTKIFFSIKEMFTATQEIQDWFTDCAEQITRVSGDTLEWVTPLGLPVIQPYHKEMEMRCNLSSPEGKESVMKYTSPCEPYQKGITFVSVHDCYWTHASSVEIMNKVCREQFVSLHKEPILEDLSAFFLDKYARVVDEAIQRNKVKEKSAARLKLRDILSTVPKKGTFNLDKVLESEYFFS